MEQAAVSHALLISSGWGEGMCLECTRWGWRSFVLICGKDGQGYSVGTVAVRPSTWIWIRPHTLTVRVKGVEACLKCCQIWVFLSEILMLTMPQLSYVTLFLFNWTIFTIFMAQLPWNNSWQPHICFEEGCIVSFLSRSGIDDREWSHCAVVLLHIQQILSEG